MRTCEGCGSRMSPFLPRKRRAADNKLVCAGCEGLKPQPFEAMRKGAPFAGYEDFDACVRANSDKDDPEAYCGRIKHNVEGRRRTASTWTALPGGGYSWGEPGDDDHLLVGGGARGTDIGYRGRIDGNVVVDSGFASYEEAKAAAQDEIDFWKTASEYPTADDFEVGDFVSFGWDSGTVHSIEPNGEVYVRTYDQGIIGFWPFDLTKITDRKPFWGSRKASRKVAYGEPHKSKAFPPGTPESTIQAWIKKLPKYVQPLVQRVEGSDGTVVVSAQWPAKDFNPMLWVRDPEWDAMIPDSMWNVGESVGGKALKPGDLVAIGYFLTEAPPITEARVVSRIDEYGVWLEGSSSRMPFYAPHSSYSNAPRYENPYWRYLNRDGRPARKQDLGTTATRKVAATPVRPGEDPGDDPAKWWSVPYEDARCPICGGGGYIAYSSDRSRVTFGHHEGVGEASDPDAPSRRDKDHGFRAIQQLMSGTTATRKHAHDSGDGETIYHCFSGETEYLTPEGRKTLADTVGTEQYVLTNPGNGGTWVQAHIHAFGEQRLYAVTVQRNKQTKVLHATDGHRWLKRGRRTEDTVVTTLDLQAGDRLSWLLPRSLIATSTPSPFGIAHGIVYGDGTRAAKGSVVNLWGDKDAQLLRYFPESRTTPIKTPRGVEGVRVLDLPAAFKGEPPLDESIPYLYGWLAGYFAADGNVTKQGQAVLDSADLGALELVERVCLRLGIATYGIRTRSRIGFGQAREVHRLQFVNSTLRPNFFLIDQHRERYDAAIERGNPERLGWTVVSVEETDRVEEVYCAVVPGTETFTLADYLHTGNCPFCGAGQVTGGSDGTAECSFCTTTFTVQVQPQRAAVPQTIDGTPHVHPDMPGSGAGEPGVPEPDVEPVEEETEVLPGEQEKNPLFAKRYFVTEAGVALDEDAYVRHLAIKFADARDEVLAQVRAERRG